MTAGNGSTPSSFVVAMPRRATARVGSGTPFIADKFRAELRTEPAKCLAHVNPDSSPRAQRARANRATIDDAVVIFQRSQDLRVVALVRALLQDAGKHERIHVSIISATSNPQSLADAQRDYALSSAELLTATLRHQYEKNGRRRITEIEIRVETNALALARLAERDDS